MKADQQDKIENYDLKAELGVHPEGCDHSLAELSEAAPCLIVFLRHTGCIFCRETLSDLSKAQAQIVASGVKIVVVTQGSIAKASKLLNSYQLQDAYLISDPAGRFYRAFELRRGSLQQLFGLSVWLRGISALLQGHGIGLLDGDGFQLSGAFLLHRSKIVKAFRQNTAADRADYCELIS